MLTIALLVASALPSVATPVDDLTGEWNGTLICWSNGYPTNRQDAKLSFAPKASGWVGWLEFRKQDTSDPSSEISFEAVAKDDAGAEIGELIVSNISWIDNPAGHNIGDILVEKYDQYVGVKFSNSSINCPSVSMLSFVPDSRDRILAKYSLPAPGTKKIPPEFLNEISSCTSVNSPDSLSQCIIETELARFRNIEFQFFGSLYFDSVIYRARSNLRSVPCSDDISAINYFISELVSYGLDPRIRIDSCSAANLVFRSMTGVSENYGLCSNITWYSQDNFLKCLEAILAVNGEKKARTLYKAIVGNEEPTERFGLDIASLWGAAFQDDYYLNIFRSGVMSNISACNSGTRLADQESQLSDAFSNALTYGYPDNDASRPDAKALRDSVTCTDIARLLVGQGLIAESEVKLLLSADGDLDLCGPTRPQSAPILREVADTTGKLALAQLCSHDYFTNLTVFGADTIYSIDEYECVASIYNLPLVLMSFRFTASNCANTQAGKSSCSGFVEMFCSAADSSRQGLDCAGRNISFRAEAFYIYDRNTCSWTAEGLEVDPKSAEIIQPLQ